jgi:hypothetical protein
MPIVWQIVKLNKQMETAAADQSKLVIDYEVQIRELSSQLALVNESKSQLELEIEEIQRRTSMDTDERVSRLQDDIQVCVFLSALTLKTSCEVNLLLL